MDRQQQLAVWVLLRDREFMRQASAAIDPLDVPQGPLRWILSDVQRAWTEDKSLLTPDIMTVRAEEANFEAWGTTKSEVLNVYLDIYECRPWSEDDKQALRTIAQKWLRGLRTARKISEAGDALDAGDLDEAERSMARVSPAVTGYGPGMGWGPKHFPPQTRPVPTGFNFFDRRWLGGIHLGQFGMVLAPSNTGKSMVLPFMAARALRDRFNVLYYTNELTEADVFKRVLSAILEEPINSIMDIPEAEQRALRMISRRIADEPEDQQWFEVRYRDAGAFSPLDLATELDILAEQGIRVHMVICDGDDLAPTVQSRDDRMYATYKNIYSQLSVLAKNRQTAIWTAAQASKDAYKTPYVKPYQVADSLWKLRLVDLGIAINIHPKALDENLHPFMPVTVIKDRYYGTRGKGVRVYPEFALDGTPGIVGFAREQEEENPDTLGI